MQTSGNGTYAALLVISTLVLAAGTGYVAWRSYVLFGQVLPALGF